MLYPFLMLYLYKLNGTKRDELYQSGEATLCCSNKQPPKLRGLKAPRFISQSAAQPSWSVEGSAHHSLLGIRADTWNLATHCAEGKKELCTAGTDR